MEKDLERHTEALIKLGHLLSADTPEKKAVLEKAQQHNPWFTSDNTASALGALSSSLREGLLEKWLQPYAPLPGKRRSPLDIGLVLAGNIPLAGFHDILCVLLSGHRAVVKLSSQDKQLTPWFLEKIREACPDYAGQLDVRDRLDKIDAVIATGSNNSARFFDFYFGKYPHIIRKNRNSAAVLSGGETQGELQELGRDIFLYFGLGCRNVSKLFFPRGYDPGALLSALEPFRDIVQHHKYANNFSYQRTILQMNGIPHYDSGFLLLSENASYSSPIATLYYEYYNSEEDLAGRLRADAELLQCLVSKGASFPGSIPFGQTQSPALWDYADNADTLKFLLSIDPDPARADG
ncbi:MAG TPA: acyl-CoA reductase [Anseongella sp.]|nr:acyl-CoA reductase [Anseongella sp.]